MTRAARVVDVRGVPLESADLTEAVDHMRGGGLLAYPTETVYGFGGLCTPEAVARLRGLKGRADEKPFLVLVRRADDVAELGWTDQARELADIFWPGAVTLVLPDPRRRFPDGVRSGTGAVAVRMSPHPVVVRLLEALGAPITSTSANVSGAPPARSGHEAAEAVARLGAGEEVLVIEAGTLPASGPSTIVDCTGPEPEVIRQGTVPVNRLRCVLPGIHGR